MVDAWGDASQLFGVKTKDEIEVSVADSPKMDYTVYFSRDLKNRPGIIDATGTR